MPEDARATRAVMATLGGLMAYWGYIDAINMAAAPHLAASFDLDDSGIAAAFGWTAAGALLSFPIARAADRRGRRSVLLWSMAVLAPLSLATALAPSLLTFVAAQMAVNALKGVLMTVIPVMVAEALATDRRAGGQAIVGAAGHVGGGLALGIVAACAGLPGDWRWGWGFAAFAALLLLLARRRLVESAHFEKTAATGEAERSRTRELFAPALRARTIGILAVGTLYPLATAGSLSWVIYHPVRNLGLEQWIATAVVIAGGAVAMLGFPIGARLSGTWGRRYTFAVSSAGFVAGAVGYYRVPADFEPHPGLALILCFGLMSLASSAAVVALRAAATELFPTRLRGAISGALAVATAGAVVAANFGVALMASLLGGIAPAASAIACTMLLGAAVFLALPETRGVELE